MDVEYGAGWARLRFKGDLDVAAAERYRQAVAVVVADCPRTLIVDFANVDFADSTALGLLAACMRSSREIGGRVFVEHANEMVQRVIKIAGFDQLLTMVMNDSDARLLRARMAEDSGPTPVSTS
jgi:anti-anti-sigma factor